MKILILICMIFCHIVDDYYLKGWLASAKQKQWWEKNAPEDLYKYDYIVALFMYSFSWSFMMMIIPTIYYLLINGNIDYKYTLIIFLFGINILIHALIDNMKANKKSINLATDQNIHILQIIWTWCILVVINY